MKNVKELFFRELDDVIDYNENIDSVDDVDVLNYYYEQVEKLIDLHKKCKTISAPDLSLLNNKLSSSNKKKFQRVCAKLAIDVGIIYKALEYALKLEDRQLVEKVGHLAFQERLMFDAITAFRYLGDCGMIKNILNMDEELAPLCIKNYHLLKYGSHISSMVNQLWIKDGYKSRGHHKCFKAMYAAIDLVPQFDIGIGVTTGGNFSTYVFNIFGLPYILVDAHRHKHGDGASFETTANLEVLRGKKILIFEDDIVSGRTLKKVTSEILPFEPKKMSVFFNITNPLGLGGVENLPKEIDEYFLADRETYPNAGDAFETMLRVTGGKI